MLSTNHILKNLYTLIRNATVTYQNEFVWQDIQLTDEFKNAYKKYLNKNRYDIEFFDMTAVITSSSGKYIFVPNQWFVIASYAVEVYEEITRYKGYFMKICDILQKNPKEYATKLRDNATKLDEKTFTDCAIKVFSGRSYTEEEVEEAVSQGYVADIVGAYANDTTLRKLVTNIDAFTVNYCKFNDEAGKEYLMPDLELKDDKAAASTEDYDTIPKPQRTRIKISGTNNMKEVKYNY